MQALTDLWQAIPDPLHDPVALAAPFFLLFVGLEGLAAYLLAPRTDVDWLSMEWGASDLHAGAWEYVAIRGGLFAASAVLVCAALALVPRRSLWITLRER